MTPGVPPVASVPVEVPVVTPQVKANPVTAFFASQTFHSFYHAALAGGMGYLAVNGFAPSKSWATGLIAAVLGGVVGWLNGTSTVTKAAVFLFAFLMVSPAMAVDLTSAVAPPTVGEDDVILAPIGAIEFNPSTKDNYGLAISESIAFAKVLPGPDSNHVVVSPYAFVGFFCAANIGQWVATNGGANIGFDYGPMVGLPKLDETIPEVAFSYNLRDGAFLINVAFPADIMPSILVHKL